MPKEVFTRHKPHITLARQRLQQTNLSAAGIEQVLGAYPISSPGDRSLVVEMVDAALNGDSSRWMRTAQTASGGSAALDDNSSRWMRTTQQPMSGNALNQLLQLGMKTAGIQQLRSGQALSNPHDRDVLAHIVTAAANDGGYVTVLRIRRNGEKG